MFRVLASTLMEGIAQVKVAEMTLLVDIIQQANHYFGRISAPYGALSAKSDEIDFLRFSVCAPYGAHTHTGAIVLRREGGNKPHIIPSGNG